MKVKFLILFILFSCSAKQDFEKDIKIPDVLKNYAKEQKEKENSK